MLILAVLLLLTMAPIRGFAQVRPADSAKVRELSQEINRAAKQNDYAKAASLMKQILALGARDSSTYYGLAMLTALGGDKSMGRKYLDTAILLGKKIGPGDAANMIFDLSSEAAKPVDTSEFFSKIQAASQTASQSMPAGYKNRRLFQIYYEDQHEREPAMQMAMNHGPIDTAYLMRLTEEDAKHRNAVYAMLKKHSITTPKDLQEASLILQHGNDTTDFWTAHELALRAVKLGDHDARWLAAATLDRYLMTKGLPQKYGTQSVMNPKTGKLELYKVDPTTTDSARAAWHVPPLKDEEKMYRK